MLPRLKKLTHGTMPLARFFDEQCDMAVELLISRHFTAARLKSLCTKVITFPQMSMPEHEAIAVATVETVSKKVFSF
jgi:hypothetical protein